MSHNVICFSSRHSVGVTFLLWSYHWLCGHDTYHRMGKGSITLPTDPSTGLNAHNFDKNIHRGYKAWQESISIYQQLENHSPVAFYGCPLKYTDLTAASVDVEDVIDKDYATAINLITSLAIPLILVVESDSDPYYFSKVRSFDQSQPLIMSAHGVPQYLIDTLDSFFANTYYQESINRDDMKIWDLREFIAFNYKHIFLQIKTNYKKLIDFTQPHLYINSKELWHDGENCIRNIMKYLGENIDESRWKHWVEVYRKWQTVHLDVLKFGWNLPHVIDAIINDYDYDLAVLELDLVRESIIQGHLIDRSLNLRTWQLEKFPNNTKDLHDLLEPLNHR